MAGQFGYEMDLGKLSEEETELVRQQIRQYKEIRSTIHFGDLYRRAPRLRARILHGSMFLLT